MRNIGRLIGERIRHYRKKRGWSQEELGFKASMHTSYVGEIERAEKSPTLDSLESISNALNVTLEELFQGTQPKGKSQEAQIVSDIVNELSALTENDLKRIHQMVRLMIDMKR